jgi:hypothetical protein
MLVNGQEQFLAKMIWSLWGEDTPFSAFSHA